MSLSGASWVQLFPTSSSLSSLDVVFRGKVVAFLNALTTAGAQVQVTATRRPRQRAYLMHYSWCMWKHWQGTSPLSIPAFFPQAGEQPVDIQWIHTLSTGGINLAASIGAAHAMVTAYQIAGLHVPPALNSNHIHGKALDMIVSWEGTLSIKDNQGIIKSISSIPRNGTNADLIKVGKSYGVHHLQNVMADPPHWSYNGL